MSPDSKTYTNSADEERLLADVFWAAHHHHVGDASNAKPDGYR